MSGIPVSWSEYFAKEAELVIQAGTFYYNGVQSGGPLVPPGSA
jgi:hypothetical protein